MGQRIAADDLATRAAWHITSQSQKDALSMRSISQGAFFSRTECVMLAFGAIAFVILAAALALHWEIDDSRRTFDLESHSVALQVSRRLAEGATLIEALHRFNDSADEEYDARSSMRLALAQSRQLSPMNRHWVWMASCYSGRSIAAMSSQTRQLSARSRCARHGLSPRAAICGSWSRGARSVSCRG